MKVTKVEFVCDKCLEQIDPRDNNLVEVLDGYSAYGDRVGYRVTVNSFGFYKEPHLCKNCKLIILKEVLDASGK